MFAGSSTPLQDDQGYLALVQVLEKVAAGRGEETGMTTPKVVAEISLRMFKMLREKQELEFKVVKENQEIERALATTQMSHMQAELSVMAEILRSCEDEALDQLKRDLETIKSQMAVWGLVERKRVPTQDRSTYVHVDSLRLQGELKEYVKAVKAYGNYVYRLWAEKKRKTFSRIEIVEQLLENFGVPEGAHAAFKRELSSAKQHLIWEHWVSSVMFNGFEGDRLLGESSLQQFLAKRYVEVFPRWLFLELGGRSQDDRGKKFEEDLKFRQLIINVIGSVWSLHQLALANVRVPATLMRERPRSMFHETRHFCGECEAMQRDSQSGGERFVQAMLTPGFRVESLVIAKCRVLCSKH